MTYEIDLRMEVMVTLVRMSTINSNKGKLLQSRELCDVVPSAQKREVLLTVGKLGS